MISTTDNEINLDVNRCDEPVTAAMCIYTATFAVSGYLVSGCGRSIC